MGLEGTGKNRITRDRSGAERQGAPERVQFPTPPQVAYVLGSPQSVTFADEQAPASAAQPEAGALGSQSCASLAAQASLQSDDTLFFPRSVTQQTVLGAQLAAPLQCKDVAPPSGAGQLGPLTQV